MPALLTVEIGPKGVTQVVSRPRTVAEASQAAQLSARTALAVRLLHETLAGESTDVIRETSPQIFIPRGGEESGDDSGEFLEFEQLPLGLADRVEPLSPSCVPAWMIDALKKFIPDSVAWKRATEHGDSEIAYTLLKRFQWVDHAGWCGFSEDGPTKFVSEPYTLPLEQLLSLVDFSCKADLKLAMHGRSNHFPSKTLRIEISKN